MYSTSMCILSHLVFYFMVISLYIIKFISGKMLFIVPVDYYTVHGYLYTNQHPLEADLPYYPRDKKNNNWDVSQELGLLPFLRCGTCCV